MMLAPIKKAKQPPNPSAPRVFLDGQALSTIQDAESDLYEELDRGALSEYLIVVPSGVYVEWMCSGLDDYAISQARKVVDAVAMADANGVEIQPCHQMIV